MKTSPAAHLATITCSALLWSACGGSEEESRPVLPTEVVVPAPVQPIENMEVVEDHSEDVANRFVDFADKLRRRDFGSAKEWLAPEFVGAGLGGLRVAEEKELPLGALRTAYDPESAATVDREGFLASIAEWIGPWERVEAAVWKVKGADFEAGRPLWGKIRFKVTFLGSGPDGGPRSLVAWANARAERRTGQWYLTAFELDSLVSLERSEFLFTDVATAVGVAHAGIRFGKPGNQSFAWNGAAGGDADGDGLWDLFVPSGQRSFLYMGRTTKEGQATFVDEAAARGIDVPGGTGAAFFDFDNDGDQDLAVADVGPLRLWRNDGEGRFQDVGPELGFGDTCDGYSLTVFDADGDGFLDVFVCNYGRVEVEANNSWIQATNGTPNGFYRNIGGERFREEATDRGLVDTSWTYAAAASDYDLDGDADLYVANDYGRNQMWINDGAGKFADAAEALGITDLGNGMGASWGDLDNDGVVDLYVSNMSSTAGNRILKRLTQKDDDAWKELVKLAAGNTIFLASRGNGTPFARLAGEKGGIGGSWAWSPVLVDLDLDGRLDVYCCSGFVTGDTPADT